MKVRELIDIVDRRYGRPETFLANVQRWLLEHGLTQVELAREAGYDPSNVNRWLRGRVTPSVRNMMCLDEALERLIDRKIDRSLIIPQ